MAAPTGFLGARKRGIYMDGHLEESLISFLRGYLMLRFSR